MRRPSALAAITCVVGLVGPLSPVRGGDDPDKVRIGIVYSLIEDNSPVVVTALLEPFASLVRAQTGLSAQVVRGKDYLSLAGQVHRGELQIGVFQGTEFAWARQAYPELRPLVVALNQKERLRAFLVVRADSRAADFADLRGKSLRLPNHSRLHSRLFLEHGCVRAGHLPPERFFSKYESASNAENALDDLVDGVVDAIVVNEVAFESYQRRKPSRCERVKIIRTSEVFPPSVVAYRPGGLVPEKLEQFRKGLRGSSQSAFSRHLMSFWRLTDFAAVPPDFDALATAIVKDYPAPEAKTAEKRAGKMRAGQ